MSGIPLFEKPAIGDFLQMYVQPPSTSAVHGTLRGLWAQGVITNIENSSASSTPSVGSATLPPSDSAALFGGGLGGTFYVTDPDGPGPLPSALGFTAQASSMAAAADGRGPFEIVPDDWAAAMAHSSGTANVIGSLLGSTYSAITSPTFDSFDVLPTAPGPHPQPTLDGTADAHFVHITISHPPLKENNFQLWPFEVHVTLTHDGQPFTTTTLCENTDAEKRAAFQPQKLWKEYARTLAALEGGGDGTTYIDRLKSSAAKLVGNMHIVWRKPWVSSWLFDGSWTLSTGEERAKSKRPGWVLMDDETRTFKVEDFIHPKYTVEKTFRGGRRNDKTHKAGARVRSGDCVLGGKRWLNYRRFKSTAS